MNDEPGSMECINSKKFSFLNIDNFELLVQPALGVLMIGTIAGNLLKDEEDA
jgi:hypothetical protein